MTFPVTIEQPLFDLILPSSKQKIKFRPFLEKERKILLMALESGTNESIQNAVKQIIGNCIVSKNIDVDKIPLIDLEWFFLQLRAKSKGEVLELTFRCENIVDEKKCNNVQEIQLNLDDIKIENLKSQKEMNISLSDKIVVKMHYPCMISNDEELSDIEYMYDTVVSCIETVFSGEEVYHSKDYSKEDLYFFVTNLNPEQFKKLQEFVNETPSLKTNLKYECNKCGFKHNFQLEGMESFFV